MNSFKNRLLANDVILLRNTGDGHKVPVLQKNDFEKQDKVLTETGTSCGRLRKWFGELQEMPASQSDARLC